MERSCQSGQALGNLRFVVGSSYQARLFTGPGMGRRDSPRHGRRGRLRLEWRNLSQPFGGRSRNHRHSMERSPLLRTGSPAGRQGLE
jgi:hypothetical protein